MVNLQITPLWNKQWVRIAKTWSDEMYLNYIMQIFVKIIANYIEYQEQDFHKTMMHKFLIEDLW